jgi:nucleosome assembly protein 1-like 1
VEFSFILDGYKVLVMTMFTYFSTEIEWYPGKCLTQKVLKKKPRKGSKNTKPITKTEDCESFFNFFSPPQVPDDDEEIDEDTVSF